METSGLELLEEKIRRAADLIRSLREERASLQRRLDERETEIESMQRRLDEAPEEDLAPEVERLREERSGILARVDRMLAILDELEGDPGRGENGQGLLAAVDGME